VPDTPRSLVTGAAGFIGSHLCERLLDEGHEVVGLDAFIDFYPRVRKEANLLGLRSRPKFRFLEADLLQADLVGLLDGIDFVFHQAGQPGVRGSWGKRFDEYLANNILATQRLLEAAKGHLGRIRRLVYASSSSVYGAVPTLPLSEDAVPRPFSPYGVTKLAGEQLCLLYHLNYGLPVVALRYFTVYGPRQRPDMAFQRFIQAGLSGEEVVIYGDGEQTRDFTYASDGVEANFLALRPEAEGRTFNIGGGARITINGALSLLERLVGQEIRRRHVLSQEGDVRHTFADVSLAGRLLGYRPRVTLQEGLAHQIEWARRSVSPAHGL
jgi:nucleoside-diphosphate-sugar epimerase